MSKPERLLFIVRHAHRDTTDRLLDNGLSSKGQQQAQRVADYLASLLKSVDTLKSLKIESSPRLRCQETLAPLCKILNLQATINPLLDERSSSEGNYQLETRIKAFVESWKRDTTKTTVISSHGDWIPYAVPMLTAEALDLNKAGIAEIHWIQNRAILFNVKQDI